MTEFIPTAYAYRCNACRRRFEVEMSFREHEPPPRPSTESPQGYPEQQPQCPTCHSHDTARVEVRAIDSPTEQGALLVSHA